MIEKFRRKNKVMLVGAGLWITASCCVVAAFVYTMYFVSTGETVDQMAKARVVALGLGFLPWIFAFGVTRALYSIQMLMREDPDLL